MGVGLATSTQLAAFRYRATKNATGARPVRTWWMSATLQPRWLETVDFRARVDPLSAGQVKIVKSKRTGGLFDIKRTVARASEVESPGEIAALTLEVHEASSVTLVIVNTVKRAVEVAEALRKPVKRAKGAAATESPEVCLVHSRFRGAERRAWGAEFLSNQTSEWVDVWVDTGWHNTKLHDYTGFSGDTSAGADGRVKVSIPPLGYVMLSPG